MHTEGGGGTALGVGLGFGVNIEGPNDKLCKNKHANDSNCAEKFGVENLVGGEGPRPSLCSHGPLEDSTPIKAPRVHWRSPLQ